MTDLAILAAYAHPDDEQGVTGTMAQLHAQGVRTGLICATRGEMGEISDPALATPETLGAVREQELRDACKPVGIDHLWFLDYRDSGMAGTPPNQDAEAFINADATEAVGRIVRIIREFKPQVVVTFDPSGGYGHPDHLAVHRWTCEAYRAASDPARYPEAGPPWTPSRLYYGAIPRSGLRRMLDYMREHAPQSPFMTMDIEQMGMPDEELTNIIDVSAQVDAKLESLRYHATQFGPDSPFSRMPEEVTRPWRSRESFAFVEGVPLPAGADKENLDLFVGLPGRVVSSQ
jgi:N-acetyl-1-D-myo-inositol-2-amino-2-deoxy-alpha-D-glucopyranoside deacetylase